ncbi:MAG: hypothetical protein ACK4V6_16570 [Microthrixaceae bacterium]
MAGRRGDRRNHRCDPDASLRPGGRRRRGRDGTGELEVASDVADLPTLRRSIFATQYELLSNGWTTRFAESDSPRLAASSEADALFLRAGVVPDDPDFVPAARYRDVTAWERR